MRLFLLLIILSCSSSLLYGQGDTLHVQYDADHGLHTLHVLNQGETLYGVARQYNMPLLVIMESNGLTDARDISIGTNLIIPISTDKIETQTNKHDTPLYYKVNPKETLYRIAKTYANKDVNQVKKLNGKTNNTLDIGEALLLGYWPISQNASVIEEVELEPTTTNTIDTSNIASDSDNNIEENIVEELPLITPESKTLRGIALTTMSSSTTEEMLVMHPTARVNSEVILFNPMMKKAVQAKVIGKLNENTYQKNISVVISPAVAKALGALDRKFWVEMSYIE